MIPLSLILAQFRMEGPPVEIFFWVLASLVILAVAATAIVVFVRLWTKKGASPVEVGNQPLHIQVTDEVPSRAEFNDLKNRVGHIEHSLAPMERRILDGVKEVGKELTAKIEDLGKHEYTARGELWGKLNVTAERVAAEEAKSEIGEAIAEGFKMLGKELAHKG